jgi:broad specificity phosphatase PhoE
MGRAMQTAFEVAAVHGLDVIPQPRLREIDCGLWTGKGRAELEVEYPDELRAWTTTPAKIRLPGGETLLEAQTRALAFFPDCMPQHVDQTIVVISHGAISHAILVEAMGGTINDLWLKERIDNCQISRLEWTQDRGLELIEMCDVRHLAEVGSLRIWRTSDVA